MANAILDNAYADVKRRCKSDPKSIESGDAILQLATISLNFLLSSCQRTALVSRVPGKTYFSFKNQNVVARPANAEYFLLDTALINSYWGKWIADTITPSEFAMLTYTVALAPCLAMELFDRQNKKGPATSFECYIGHLFAKAVGVNPTQKVQLPVHGKSVLMTMDFLFDMGNGRRKVHLPVKMSSRERVVQAWAHQRMLDSAYGSQTYQGVLVLFSETKLDSRSLEVVEICVPDQWLAYQTLLAKMNRIYYFDVPARYRKLTQDFPQVINIKQFGEFFQERAVVLQS